MFVVFRTHKSLLRVGPVLRERSHMTSAAEGGGGGGGGCFEMLTVADKGGGSKPC